MKGTISLRILLMIKTEGSQSWSAVDQGIRFCVHLRKARLMEGRPRYGYC
jgi:hypothetical protein